MVDKTGAAGRRVKPRTKTEARAHGPPGRPGDGQGTPKGRPGDAQGTSLSSLGHLVSFVWHVMVQSTLFCSRNDSIPGAKNQMVVRHARNAFVQGAFFVLGMLLVV